MAETVAPMDVRLMAAVTGSLDGVNVRALCRAAGVSPKTFYKWRSRALEEGLEGLQPRSRRPHRSPSRLPDAVEDRVVELRKQLVDLSMDAGSKMIVWRLRAEEFEPLPSEATVWRMLVRRGFVTEQPSKRPRSSWRRFEAASSNEMWQIDGTDWALLDATPVKIINLLDDHSRYVPASAAGESESCDAAWGAFSGAVAEIGWPSRCLSDNGLAFTGRLRGVEVEFERRLREAGVVKVNSRPYHPQTCGKVERFQQTQKKWLAGQEPCATIEELQAQLDRFRHYYNFERPHTAARGATPWSRFQAGIRLVPDRVALPAPQRHVHVTVTNVGALEIGRAAAGRVTIGIGARYAGRAAEVFIDATHATVFIDGTLIRHLELDPTRRYQRQHGRP